MLIRSKTATVFIVLAASCTQALAAEVTGRIAVGSQPTAIAVDEARDRIFVVGSSMDNTISIIDGKKEKVVKKVRSKGLLDLSIAPGGISYDPDLDRLYFPVNKYPPDQRYSMVFADLKTNRETKVLPNERSETGWISGVYYLRDAKELFYLDWNGYLRFFDTLGKKKREFPTDLTGKSYYSVSGDGSTLYVFGRKTGLAVVNMRDGSSRKIPNIPDTQNVTSPLIDNSTGYVFLIASGKLLKVSDREIVASIDNAFSGVGMALNTKTRHLFVPSGEDSVAVVDPDRMEVISTLKVGKGPRNFAVNSKTGRVYVVCTWDQAVYVIKD